MTLTTKSPTASGDDINDGWVTAVHEAAHTIVASLNSLVVEEVRLRKSQSKNSNGYMLLFESQSDLSNANQMIQVLMAGNIATNIVTKAATWHRAGRDEKRALQLIVELLYEDENFEDYDKKKQDEIIWAYRDQCFRNTVCTIREPFVWHMILSFARTIHKLRVLRLSSLRLLLYRLAHPILRTPRTIPFEKKIAPNPKKSVIVSSVPSRKNIARIVSVVNLQRQSIKSKSFHDYIHSKGRKLLRSFRKNDEDPLPRRVPNDSYLVPLEIFEP